jgi:O-methyltransferase
MIKKILNNFLGIFSYKISKIINLKPFVFFDEFKDFDDLLNDCSKESLNIGRERFLSLYESINYIFINNIEGDFVECGVYKGGSSMMMASLIKKTSSKKKLWMYDTFKGMTPPDENDVDLKGVSAKKFLETKKKIENDDDIWAYSSLEYVKKNIRRTGINEDQCEYIAGPVENTLKVHRPKKISLLRLDTDFYSSTKFELDYLYSILSKNGIIIIDDYGHWRGCKKAVDDFFKSKKNFFFSKIDYSGIVGIKLED